MSGFIWLYPEEVQVADHPAFQRLGRIYQLGQTYLLYRGGTHKRIEHALGTLHVVQRMIDAVQHNSQKATGAAAAALGPPLSESEWRFVRLGALLHDIGHIAAGHTVEDELCLVGKHDADARLNLVFEDQQWANESHRNLSQLVDEAYRQYVPLDLKEHVSPSVIVRLLIRKPPQPPDPDTHRDAQAALARSASIRLNVCRDMIGNTICADILDYLHRDWYHLGKPRPFDDRILQYMEIRADGPKPKGASPSPSPTDRFVLSLGRRPKIRTDAVSAILELLEWRYQLAESVLFHRTKLVAAAMLDRALFELWGNGDGTQIESTLVPLSDEEMLSTCRKLATSGKPTSDQRAETAAALLERLEKRQLFAHLKTRFYGDLPTDVSGKIESTYGRSSDPKKSAAWNRNRVLRVLEGDFGLPAGSLVMYCPGGVNAKVAEVRIAVGDEIERFCDYEKKHNNFLSGGHLDAQLHRFRRLWRIHFFIEPMVKAGLGDRLVVLEDAVEKLALGHCDNPRPDVSRDFAIRLTSAEGSPWHARHVREEPVSAAYQNPGAVGGDYPLGARSIRSYIDISAG